MNLDEEDFDPTPALLLVNYNHQDLLDGNITFLVNQINRDQTKIGFMLIPTLSFFLGTIYFLDRTSSELLLAQCAWFIFHTATYIVWALFYIFVLQRIRFQPLLLLNREWLDQTLRARLYLKRFKAFAFFNVLLVDAYQYLFLFIPVKKPRVEADLPFLRMYVRVC